MVGVLSAGGLDISRKLLDQVIQPGKVSLEPLVLFFRQKDIAIFSKGQISLCCSHQVASFQVVLITLVRCAFLRNHVAHFCTVMLGIFAYCDCAILRSMRNLEQNTAGLGKAAAGTFHELCIFQFGKRSCYAGNAASQIFCKTRKRIDHINTSLCIDPAVLLRKRCPVQQQGIEQLCCVAQVCIQQKAGIGQILW